MSELLRQSEDPKRAPIPRMSLRYSGVTPDVTLRVQARGFLGRRRVVRIDGELLDVSIGGALVRIPDDAGVQQGVRIDLTIEGEHATVGVRHIEEGTDGCRQCGVAFRTTSPGFDAVVNETIASAITDPKRHEAWRMLG